MENKGVEERERGKKIIKGERGTTKTKMVFKKRYGMRGREREKEGCSIERKRKGV